MFSVLTEAHSPDLLGFPYMSSSCVSPSQPWLTPADPPFSPNTADAGKPSHTRSGKHIYFSTVPYMRLLSRKKKKNSYKPKLSLRSHDCILIKLPSMKRIGAFCKVNHVYDSVFNCTRSLHRHCVSGAVVFEARLWWNWTLFPSYFNRAAAFIFPVNFESQFCKCGTIKYVQD